ncbi:large conductance mechanosensitive channel protein MscL [Mesobacillus foraminis]|uniref:large conductance mechanosensitive channel protein MscL n=1 Tax=Mesobacillus foraminis TaxID=279826 RepID=UPI000EF50FD9|nr:large conductance mechanosensitive channel protein MscL [Mesobacillus foraminis]MBT2758360.1 large conductance mechanosensitive channel protein MscL [Mesobacillus foraminis]
MWNEFKKFALKGNVMDLAVGVIIGGAFGKIVSSLVNDIIMPVVGILLGGIKISNQSYFFGNAELKYGAFLQTVVDFFIISFSIFLFIRLISRFKRKKEEETVEEIKADVKEELLMEIRDLLKMQAEASGATGIRERTDRS